MVDKIKKNVPLSKFTTFRVGGPARYFAEVRKDEELEKLSLFAREKSIPIFVLGGGSDVLVSDEGFKGLVIRYKNKSLEFQEGKNFVFVKAGAGLIWDNLVKKAVSKNLQGIECLSGIPGTVGAAPIQNIGAYGQELKDVFVNLTAFDFKLNRLVVFSKKRCCFGYRESVFKKPQNKGRFLITKVSLKLNKNKKPKISYQSLIEYLEKKRLKNPTLLQVRKAVLALRSLKLEDPKFFGNAGSFFKNPIVGESVKNALSQKYKDIPFFALENGNYKLFAGWLIEKAGWKGKNVGNAMVSKKNALVIINTQNKATAKEIFILSRKIISDVWKKFRIKLEPEVQFIGF